MNRMFLFCMMVVMLSLSKHGVVTAQGVGEFNDTVSTALYNPINAEWVTFSLIDSAGTADTIIVEEYNPWANKFNPIIVRNDSSNTVTAVIHTVVMGANGFTVWIPYPKLLRFRRTDVHALTDKVYYYIQQRGNK